MIIGNPNPSLLLSTSGDFGGRHQSTILLRTVTLLVLSHKIKILTKKRLDAIQFMEEVEKEVAESNIKESYDKLCKSQELLNRLFGHNDEDGKDFLFSSNMPLNVSVTLPCGRFDMY